MIRLRGYIEKEVVELDPSTQVWLIDGLHYTATKKVLRIGAKTRLDELRAFEMVEVDTGIDDDEQPRIMTILPKRKNGTAALIASMVMGVATFGCGSGATYHYSYTCYGDCPVPAMPQRVVSYQTVQPAQVVYVDRPHEIIVRNGFIDTSKYNSRRAAKPRRIQ